VVVVAGGGTLDMTYASIAERLTAGRDDKLPLNRFHKARRCSVLLPVFASFIEMVIAALRELV
jgi:hypothetical protein